MTSILVKSHLLFKNQLSVFKILRQPLSSSTKERKRFYKNVTICESSQSVAASADSPMFEINLDKRKLKTPTGKLFQVDNVLLAQMVAQEWKSQQATIKLNTMHLTSLVNTCMDNPNKLTKESIKNNLCEYLSTDTLIYFDTTSKEKLAYLQQTHWKPLVDWFNLQFNDSKLKIKHDIEQEIISSSNESSFSEFRKFLEKNFDLDTLIALNYMCECLKSVIISVALLERCIQSVDEACFISNIEQRFQSDQWGQVEWYHDVNEEELKSRVAAALLFIYLSNKSKYLVVKRSF